jgi:hypothetical protein
MKVSWDDDIPNIWKNTIHVPNHQPEKNGEMEGMGINSDDINPSPLASLDDRERAVPGRPGLC